MILRLLIHVRYANLSTRDGCVESEAIDCRIVRFPRPKWSRRISGESITRDERERIHLPPVTLFLARKSDYEWLTELQLAGNFASDKLTFPPDKATATREERTLYNGKTSLANQNLIMAFVRVPFYLNRKRIIRIRAPACAWAAIFLKNVSETSAMFIEYLQRESYSYFQSSISIKSHIIWSIRKAWRRNTWKFSWRFATRYFMYLHNIHVLLSMHTSIILNPKGENVQNTFII